MNFIFDVGNVLVDFKPELFLSGFIGNHEKEKVMNETIFKSDEWVMLDKDTISTEDACRLFCERQPEYKDLIIKTMQYIPEMFTPKMETIEWLPRIIAKGHRLFYLSNFHKDLSLDIQKKYDFFNLFEGGVFSYEIHMTKPDMAIYQCLIDRFNLDVADCIFFDDMIENVKAACRFGMCGVLFECPKVIAEYI